MNLIESMKKDKIYIKHKLTVKTWEKDFKVKYSRTPSKYDIKEAPPKIRYAYKKYFQLKSAALENSLSCDIDEELTESPESAPNLENDVLNSLSPKSEQLVQTLPSGEELEQLINNIQENKELKSNTQSHNHFTENLSKKLFQNRKFSMRNPRKLSVSKSQITASCLNKTLNKNDESNGITKKDSQITCQENVNTNIEGNINDNNIKINSVMNMNISPEKLKNPLSSDRKLRQINDSWFERATGLNIAECTEDNESVLRSNERYGISNIKTLTTIEKINDYIENSESDEENITIRNLKPAFKKRKIDVTVTTTHVTQENLEHKNEIKPRDSNDQNRTKRKTKTTKVDDMSKEQRPPDIAEYVSYGLDEVTPRHSDLNTVLKMINKSTEVDNTENKTDSRKTENLRNKVKNGSINDNFVKINIEKKKYVRGKKHINFTSYKKQQWRNKKALHSSMEISDTTCFKCGINGHMARYCTAHKGDILLPLENCCEDNIPTLQDMQNNEDKELTLDDMQNILSNTLTLPKENNTSAYKSNNIPDSFLKMLTLPNTQKEYIKPIYINYREEYPKELYDTLQMFGYKSFRPGQEQAIMRILCGMSTLLLLPTGGGKSLCYQLPAYIYSQKYKCITLVISPLVSLMEDQVINMPEFLKAGCLHTNQTPTQRQKILQCLKDGNIKILLISPEALVLGDTSGGFLGSLKSLPQIAFACIDEVHCVSQWSHNFRPSYLMICRVLREKLNVKCILGLTATASQATIKSVISHINIPDGPNGVITNPALPDNLCLSVSIEKDKDKALITYLTSNPIKSIDSIIIYCIRRDECERIAAIVRASLQEQGQIAMETNKKKRKRMSYIAEAYHAGMSAAHRKKIQKHFMDGSLKIIVATVAFGMGINKPDIRCIIHYNIPSSFESYVQEVGRAGRDGNTAFCHILLNNKDNSDKNELLKHIHANSVDRPTIRRLLQKVFIPCDCCKLQQGISSNNVRCKGHEVGIPIEKTVEELDLPSENIITLLCYLELHPKQYVKILNKVYIMCKILSYGGPKKILESAKTCPPLAMAYLLESKKNPDIMHKTVLEFNIIEIASAIGWESGMCKYHLKNLEWITNNGTTKKSQLKIEFNTLGFRIKAPGDLTPTELDTMLDDLYETVQLQEKAMLYQLEESYNAFNKIGHHFLENDQLSEDTLLKKSVELKSMICAYFQRKNNIPSEITLKERPLDSESIISDVQALISIYKDCKFTGRSIAKIFQGISSPNYPAVVWGKCKFWRSHIHEDFYGLVRLATQQILKIKMA